MIIVSQNKNKIINFDNMRQIRCINSEKQKEIIRNTGLDIFDSIIKEKTGISVEDIKGYGIYVYFDNEDNIILGQYKTEERAKEVLQEIKYKYTEYVQLNNPRTGIEGIYAIPKVYEMPEK